KGMWKGTLKSKHDFLNLSSNTVELKLLKKDKKDNKTYMLNYINYEKDLKEVYKKAIVKTADCSVSEFIESKEYTSLVDYSNRNIGKFCFDISVSMGFNVKNEFDFKSFDDEKPGIIVFEKNWMFNQFKPYKNDFICFHNLIPINQITEIIKINGNGTHIMDVNVGEKHKNKIMAYQIFNNNPGTYNILSNVENKSNKVYFVEENKYLDLKPGKKFSSETKNVKALTKQLEL
ncbi:unnamed protein product, partial [marine sediment metagenome]